MKCRSIAHPTNNAVADLKNYTNQNPTANCLFSMNSKRTGNDQLLKQTLDTNWQTNGKREIDHFRNACLSRVGAMTYFEFNSAIMVDSVSSNNFVLRTVNPTTTCEREKDSFADDDIFARPANEALTSANYHL